MRAVVRWAVRLFRREWRQQLLVLGLLAIGVAGAVAGSTMAVGAASDGKAFSGDADARVQFEGEDAAAAVAEARARFHTVDVIAHTRVPVPGSTETLDVRDQDPDGAYSKPMLAVRRGRYPTGAGEVALTADAADELDTALGGTVSHLGRVWRVVGIVENPAELTDDFSLVAPGQLPAPRSYTLLLNHDDRTDATAEGRPLRFESMGSEKASVAAAALAMAILALVLVGLVAAAGFVVIAQRRLRQLGLLAATGASHRHVRLVVIANGAVVGLLAAVVGTALGFVGWLLAAPAVESAANHRIDRWDLPWTLVVAIPVLAVVVATAAAWWPARVASRVPVMVAISGRPTPPRSVHRSLLLATVLVVGGVAAIAGSNPRSSDVRPLPLVVGIVAVVLGAVAASPAAVRVLGALARRLPVAPRLALRDLARHQARAAAALAAITFALAIAVAIVVIAASSESSADEGNLSSRELLIRTGDPRSSVAPELTASETQALDRRAADVVTALGNDARAVALDVAFGLRPPNANRPDPVSVGLRRGPDKVEFVSFPYVATPEVLAAYGVDRASIDESTDVLTSRNDPLVLFDIGAGNRRAAARRAERQHQVFDVAPTQRVDLPMYDAAPNSLITEAAVARHGWTTVRAAWIVESSHPLSGDEIAAARRTAASVGLAVEVRSTEAGLALLRTIATLVGALLALAVVAMAVGLIRGEAANDVRTLTATGAGPGVRRTITASTAAGLAVPGVVLGILGAYIAVAAAFHSDLSELTPVPVVDLVALAVGLPVAAAAAGWLLGGGEPASFAREVLE